MKYHINNDNQIMECHDSSGRCPYVNYDSIDEAKRVLSQETFNMRFNDKYVKRYGTNKIRNHSMIIDKPTENLLVFLKLLVIIIF